MCGLTYHLEQAMLNKTPLICYCFDEEMNKATLLKYWQTHAIKAKELVHTHTYSPIYPLTGHLTSNGCYLLLSVYISQWYTCTVHVYVHVIQNQCSTACTYCTRIDTSRHKQKDLFVYYMYIFFFTMYLQLFFFICHLYMYIPHVHVHGTFTGTRQDIPCSKTNNDVHVDLQKNATCTCTCMYKY